MFPKSVFAERETDGKKPRFLKSVFTTAPSLLAGNTNKEFATGDVECIVEIEPQASAAVKANTARQKANEGYLVIAAKTTPGHIAPVGSQYLQYDMYPDYDLNGNKIEFIGTTGNDTEGQVLSQYPVFVQAGGYTGIVNPSFAFGNTPFNNNDVRYYFYSPWSEI